MIKHIAIVGASGHGKVVADLAELLGYEVHFFDDAFPEKKVIEHWEIKGTFSDIFLDPKQFSGAVVAIGDNTIRKLKCQSLIEKGIALPKLIHPSAVVSKYVKIGMGSVVFASSVINAFTEVGKGCIINSSSVIEHDCRLEDYVHVSPSAALAGNVSVKHDAWIGIGANIKQGLSIGEASIVGAGAAVISDVSDNVIVAGVPAKVIKS